MNRCTGIILHLCFPRVADNCLEQIYSSSSNYFLCPTTPAKTLQQAGWIPVILPSALGQICWAQSRTAPTVSADEDKWQGTLDLPTSYTLPGWSDTWWEIPCSLLSWILVEVFHVKTDTWLQGSGMEKSVWYVFIPLWFYVCRWRCW